RTLRLLLRITGGIANHISKILVNLYDLFIMIPLALERAVKSWRRSADHQPKTAHEDAPWEDDYNDEEIAAIEAAAKEANEAPRKRASRDKTSSDTPRFTPQEA